MKMSTSMVLTSECVHCFVFDVPKMLVFQWGINFVAKFKWGKQKSALVV